MPSRRALCLLGLLALPVVACGHEPPPSAAGPSRELVLSYDDNRPAGVLSFPNLTYESLVRFELPPGKHRPLRLRALVAGPGSLQLTLYTNSPLEAPAEPVGDFAWNVAPADVSSGKDGHWLVADLSAVSPLEGVLWVGVRKVGGEPALWTSTVASGQSFLRDRAPHSSLGILPVKRTPMVRLELGF